MPIAGGLVLPGLAWSGELVFGKLACARVCPRGCLDSLRGPQKEHRDHGVLLAISEVSQISRSSPQTAAGEPPGVSTMEGLLGFVVHCLAGVCLAQKCKW